MITFFNRKELFITFSNSEYIRIKNILSDNRIEYSVKCTNRQFWNRSRTGSFGLNSEYLYDYKIYVKREDYKKALYLIAVNR